MPWLYLKGISTGDFTEALAALLGPDAPGLSASTITRLKDVWQGELARWEKRDLSARYLYFFASCGAARNAIQLFDLKRRLGGA